MSTALNPLEESLVHDIRAALSDLQEKMAEVRSDNKHILQHLERQNGRIGKAEDRVARSEDRISALERRESASTMAWAILGAVAGAIMVAVLNSFVRVNFIK